jgi:hypothetical protein
VEWDGAEWNKYSIPLFGYFKKESNKIDGKWWYEMKFIPYYSISFHYYLSNLNNETLFYLSK